MGTLDYYNQHADEFCAGTVHADMSSLYGPFERLLPAGGHVLDAGCGSGRDSLHFLRAGYQVTAFDGSSELAARASRLTGLPVRCMTFDQVSEVGAYDGIWACSSLLHLSPAELRATLPRLVSALRPGGVFYASFKYGTFCGERNGRHFTDLTEDSLVRIFCADGSLRPLDLRVTHDVRPGRESEPWLNALRGRESGAQVPGGR